LSVGPAFLSAVGRTFLSVVGRTFLSVVGPATVAFLPPEPARIRRGGAGPLGGQECPHSRTPPTDKNVGPTAWRGSAAEMKSHTPPGEVRAVRCSPASTPLPSPARRAGFCDTPPADRV